MKHKGEIERESIRTGFKKNIFLGKSSNCGWVGVESPKTRNKMRVAIESGNGMKVKVVKLC